MQDCYQGCDCSSVLQWRSTCTSFLRSRSPPGGPVPPDAEELLAAVVRVAGLHLAAVVRLAGLAEVHRRARDGPVPRRFRSADKIKKQRPLFFLLSLPPPLLASRSRVPSCAFLRFCAPRALAAAAARGARGPGLPGRPRAVHVVVAVRVADLPQVLSRMVQGLFNFFT